MQRQSNNTLLLTCPKCQRKIRQLARDLAHVKSRICPECGMKITLQGDFGKHPDAASVPRKESAPATVTIIDDERGVRESLGIYSELLGCRTVLIADVSSIVSSRFATSTVAINETTQEVLVVDQDLPGTTGLEFISKLQGQGCTIPNHRKAILSESLSREEFRMAKKLGCHVLQKPVTFEIFESWLEKLKPN